MQSVNIFSLSSLQTFFASLHFVHSLPPHLSLPINITLKDQSPSHVVMVLTRGDKFSGGLSSLFIGYAAVNIEYIHWVRRKGDVKRKRGSSSREMCGKERFISRVISPSSNTHSPRSLLLSLSYDLILPNVIFNQYVPALYPSYQRQVWVISFLSLLIHSFGEGRDDSLKRR